jgi:NAD(P)-dependent dehydrogenase (short-subunit alcohol dehydrogenase family)
MRLKDRVAIVTGGGGGLGEGICTCLAREGAHVVVSDIKQDLAERVSAKVKALGRKALAIRTDVRRADSCREMVDVTLREMGRLDILVANAGVDGLPRVDDSTASPLIEHIKEEDWDLVVDVNLKGVFLCNRAVAPHFKEKRSGRIINIASVAGRQGVDFLAPYAATKAGVISFTQSVALQMAPYHVNVNAVCPGIIWTPMWERLASFASSSLPDFGGAPPKDVFNLVVQTMIPFKKEQTPTDIGNAVVFLASDEASEITGQALNVCGGMRMN